MIGTAASQLVTVGNGKDPEKVHGIRSTERAGYCAGHARTRTTEVSRSVAKV